MTRTIGANLTTHLAGAVTTLSFLWNITRTDATEFYFTDADADIVYDGNTYKSLNAGELSSFQQATQLAVDNFDFMAILDSSNIDRDDVIAGLFDHATVRVYLINRESTADGVVSLARGVLGKTNIINENSATIEFRSLTQLLQQTIGHTAGHECDADLGDTRCGVTLATYTETGTLDGVTDNVVFADSARAEADDYFNYGLLTWTGGNNNGIGMEVKDFANATGTFTLVAPMPFTVQVGDTYSVYRGCDKIRTTCKDVFSNLVNFRGTPDIPGFDMVAHIPDVHKDAGLHE